MSLGYARATGASGRVPVETGQRRQSDLPASGFSREKAWPLVGRIWIGVEALSRFQKIIHHVTRVLFLQDQRHLADPSGKGTQQLHGFRTGAGVGA